MNKDRPKYTIFNLIPYPFRLSCCHYEVFAHYVIPETSKIDICMFTSEGNYPVVDGPIQEAVFEQVTHGYCQNHNLQFLLVN